MTNLLSFAMVHHVSALRGIPRESYSQAARIMNRPVFPGGSNL
jgi:hypothetical protein